MVSTPQQLESVIGALSLVDGQVDPQHGEGFEETGVAERTNIDRVEAGIFDERLDQVLGAIVVAAVKAGL